MTQATSGAKFYVTAGYDQKIPPMPQEEFPGTEGFIGDVYANPEGSPMSAGYFRLKHTDAPLDYTYSYDEMKVVLKGTFSLENPDTGQVETASEGDAIFFPKGSRILFSTDTEALAYYVGFRTTAP